MRTGEYNTIDVEAGKTADGPVVVIRSGCFGCVLTLPEAEEFKAAIDKALDRAFQYLSEDMDGADRWHEKEIEV